MDLQKQRVRWKRLREVAAASGYHYMDAFAITVGAYISRGWEGEPLWVLFIAPPGSGKTCTVAQLDEAEAVMTVSSLTPASLITAWGGPDSDRSLLSVLNDALLIVKDFGTILTMDHKECLRIMGLLREAFDGHVSRDFAMLRREYWPHFNLLACTTEFVYEHQTLWGALGDRFVRWEVSPPPLQWPVPLIAASLPNYVSQWLAATDVPSTPVEAPRWAYDLAELVAQLRTGMRHDWRTGELTDIRRPEKPLRLARQFAKLYQCVVAATGDEEYARRVAQRAAYHSVPDRRRVILATLSHSPTASLNDFRQSMRVSISTIRQSLGDLVALGVLEVEEDPTDRRKSCWRLAPDLGVLISRHLAPHENR